MARQKPKPKIDKGSGHGAISRAITLEARRMPDARTVTESRLLGLIRWGRETCDLYAAGAALGTLRPVAYRRFYVCRAVQAWQLTRSYWATAWIDSGHDGVHLFADEGQAMGKYALLCAALEKHPPPEGNGYYQPTGLDPTQKEYDA